MLLRTHFRTQDFMKDIVILLSNISDNVKLPSKDDALSLLHFLLSFAPNPNPTLEEHLRFSFYQPRMHRYFPPAIDSLAKLIIIDFNRHYFKAIFADPTLSPVPHASDSPTSPGGPAQAFQQYSLLTRAFGLAIAVLPERTGLQLSDEGLVQVREATVSQGLLTADVLAGLLPPSSEASMALSRAWLSSHDGWVTSLLNVCRSILNHNKIRDMHQWRAFVCRALGMLRKLALVAMGRAERKGKAGVPSSQALLGVLADVPAQNGDVTVEEEEEEGGKYRVNGELKEDGQVIGWDDISVDLPNWYMVVGAVNLPNTDVNVLRNLIALASLDEQ